MKKKCHVLTIVALLVLGLASIVIANSTIVTPNIAVTDPTDGMIYIGENFTVTATTFKNGSGVVDKWEWLGIDYPGNRTLVPASPSGDNYVNTATFTAPATAGTYTLNYYIRMTAGPNDWTGDVVTDIVVLVPLTIDVEYAAAPAVAIRLLNAADVPHRYGSGKTGGNWISDVARQMGPGASFPAMDGSGYVEKSNRSAYEAEIRAYLIGRGVLSE